MKRILALTAIGATALITISLALPHLTGADLPVAQSAGIATSAPSTAATTAPAAVASDSLSSSAKKLLEEAKKKAAELAAKAKAAQAAAAAKKAADAKAAAGKAPTGGAAWNNVTFTGAKAKTSLATLKVAPAGTMAGYSRDNFKTWDKSTLGAGCDTRDAVLYRDATAPKIGANCHITGTWADPYTGTTLRDQSDLDIDHMVPLAAAWRSGAATWTASQRETYANSPLVTLAVDNSANRQKGDKTPDQWKPANTGDYCAYAVRWTEIKTTWKLSVTTSEKTALTSMLGTCK
ncbi:hypothetical protein GCM10025867_50310 (plasmid) [Frondihabitans sucicola]|uniref:GmrSD restriction endonucleases C-terminal domain-containing protein n=1 Tax=Frondihabitans sucicola TaxID=1268041 RepID=A0ABN6YA13_9MICO|nr:HNH endonuclease family protein [Frondihabitans sucicola]BDZ52790.1 hypothetical protein GCM10025867_50310 [Frondihabitans sucicola]